MLGRSVKPVVPSTSRVNPDLDLDRNVALAHAHARALAPRPAPRADTVAAAPFTSFF